MTATLHRSARDVLLAVAAAPTPWRERQAELADAIPNGDVYLGGDGLRPYLTWTVGDHVHACFIERPDLPTPPFIAEILAGRYGVAVVQRDEHDPMVVTMRVARSPELAARLDVPRLLLVGLGDAERYRGARLSLGVARLGQWLRYTHCADVTICDYNLLDRPLDTVDAMLSGERFEAIGVSVNFGQWRILEELAEVVNRHDPPAVVLGNILAAYTPLRAARLFAAARRDAVAVATTLGELPLQALCGAIADPASWDAIPGLVRPTVQPTEASAPAAVQSPDLVFPDDALIREIAERHGQLSLETSFGCQYGACTFCPRSHRGEGWERGHVATVVAALERIARTGAVLSIVDEEFFGREGLADPPAPALAAGTILGACRRLGISYEIYTRLEQLFDRRRSLEWNLQRAELLAREAPAMRRIFVGVESGSGSQLRRYGKGQTVPQTVDALRVGSALGIPMEFGFITLDPLLTPDELVGNITFLGRTDIIKSRVGESVPARVAAVERYVRGERLDDAGVPLYQHVAYMATELEVLAYSRYADHLQRRHPALLDGDYDPNFARFSVRYRDERVGAVAGWCRVWTEGMFTPVYQARMTARSAGEGGRGSRDGAALPRCHLRAARASHPGGRLRAPATAGRHCDRRTAGR